ncbi:MAG: hypothetical protein ABIP95_06240 [Pelobium sp.]
MYKFVNPEILNTAVQDFINNNLNIDIQKLILKGSPFPKVTVQELAVQLEGKKKAQKKIPKWFNTSGILYPPKLNLEQSSSEITANYKANLIGNGELIDLTGGFGVDDMAFAAKAELVYHCETNEALSELVKHNAQQFELKNIEFIVGDSLSFLKQSRKVDTIYVDPSRRANTGRVFLLKDCEPNVIENLDLYLQKAKKVIIKAAPLLDISSALADLKKVNEVHIISVNNECKELLFVLENHQKNEPKIYCALINDSKTTIEQFSYSEEKALALKHTALATYLYEPDVAILKAGFFKSITLKYQVAKLHQHTHLYTSTNLVDDFPGKIFKVIKSGIFQNFKADKSIAKANVVTRNFDLKPDEIKKKFKIKDGGSTYLFFSTNSKDQKIVIQAERLAK